MVRVRLEHHGDGPRFLELELREGVLTRTWGALDRAPGGSRAVRFEREADAARALARQVASATAKGYWVGHHNPEMIAAIVEAPDDEARYLAYGDWLLARDDPRGALMHADGAWHAELLAQHPRALAPRHHFDAAHVQWWRGFARGVVVKLDPHQWRARHISEDLPKLLVHPSFHFLRAFALELSPADHAAWRDRAPQELTSAWYRGFLSLPPTVARVAVSPGPLVQAAEPALGFGRVEVVPGPLGAWLAEAAAPPR